MLIGDTAIDGTKILYLTNGSERKVQLKCDNCGKISETTYHNYTIGQKRNGNTGKTQCKTCAVKDSSKKRIGQIPWNKGKPLPDSQRGENHPSWKGGRYIDAHGYVMIHCPKENATCKWDHYRKEHTVIMEKYLGRELNKNEIVHHIDGDKTNNKLDNLILCSNSEHRDMHVSIQNFGYELIKKGLLYFDHQTKSYIANTKMFEFLEQVDLINKAPEQIDFELDMTQVKDGEYFRKLIEANQ
jgi:hypothetical protein